MRSTFKVLFYVNGSKEKNGIVPIMGRVTINGSVAQFSCKLTIAKTMWDAKGNRAKGKSKEARDINLALDNIKAQIIKHYQRISDREAYVTAEMELVELFGVIAPTLRAAIKAIYKSGTLCLVSTQRCDLATPKSWATFYNLEVVIVLAFRLKTYEASRIRQKVLESLCKRKENEINLLISLGHDAPMNRILS